MILIPLKIEISAPDPTSKGIRPTYKPIVHTADIEHLPLELATPRRAHGSIFPTLLRSLDCCGVAGRRRWAAVGR